MTYQVLRQPLSEAELKACPNGWAEGVVAIELNDFIEHDFDAILDIMSEKLTGHGLLTDIEYEVVGHEDKTTLHICVRGDLGQTLELLSEE